MQDLNKALELDSSNGTFYFNRALIKYDGANYTGAIKDYGLSIKYTNNKSAFRSYYNRGNCHRK